MLIKHFSALGGLLALTTFACAPTKSDDATANRYYDQIKAQVHADTRKRVPEGALSNATFDAAFEDVTDVVEGRVAALRAAIAAN